MFEQFAKSQAARFARDENGGIAMIFGLMVLIISVFAGAGLDFSRSVTARAKLSSALDAAILTAARGLSQGALDEKTAEAELRRIFAANVAGAFLQEIKPKIADFKVNMADSTIKASAAGSVPAALVQLAGIENIGVGVSSSATFNQDRVEIAMMLDVTGSMGGSKIKSLKKAATLAVDTIIPSGRQADPDKVRIALVPYSQGVNAGPYARQATGKVSGKCATERVGKYAYSNVSPRKAAIGTGSSDCPTAAILPLESDATTLKNRIKSFKTKGWTSGNVGIAWAWYALSKQWNGLWPAGSDAQSSGSANVHKYAILMTDGLFNTVYDKNKGGKYKELNPNNTKNDKSEKLSNKRAVELCKAMKKDKIVVFTIAFDLKDPTAIKTLKACKSDVGYQTYYNAASEKELEGAYLEIASLIQNLWLSK